MIGEGKNIWPHVEVHEGKLSFIQYVPGCLMPLKVAEFYQILLDATLSDPNTPHGRDGYYIAENGEYRLHDLAKAYSQALYDLGKGKSAEPTSFTAEEAQKYFGVITAMFFVISNETETDAHGIGCLAR